MTDNFLSQTFPSNDVTDGQYLYRALGSFWTQIFQDRSVLKGYTTGMAEELVQSYTDLVETVNQYSVKKIDTLHTVRWQPLIIKKSEYDQAPFVFEPDNAVFGLQQPTDEFYANQLFRFGYSKQTESKTVASYTPSFKLNQFGLIADRIIAPTTLLLPGVDVVLKENTLYFNSDLFNNPNIPRAKLVGALGAPVTYTNSSGAQIEDEFIVLWIYKAGIDTAALYNNFGCLLDLQFSSSEAYKAILQGVMNLAVEGPTIKALNIALAGLLGLSVVLDNNEVVEEIYSDNDYQFIITDKHAYRLPNNQITSDKVKVGNVLHMGDQLTDAIKVVDAVVDPVWWRTQLTSNKLAVASHVFAASVGQQLFFENKLANITYSAGSLYFPVQGNAADVAAFQHRINEPAQLSRLLAALGMSSGEDSTMTINPVDFLFSNVFRNNALLLKLEFYSTAQMEQFFMLLPTIQKYLPAHAYVVVYISQNMAPDELTNLNTGLAISAYAQQSFSCDGSNAITGSRAGTVLPVTNSPTDPDYYKDTDNRLFSVSVGPYRNGMALHEQTNLDYISINNTVTSGGIQAGRLRTYIPENATTKEVPSILLIDF
jgi:hypothetical protein